MANTIKASIIEEELGRCMTLNTAGLTDIKIAEYREWFKANSVVALQETHGAEGQEQFLTKRLGFNQGAFSFKSRARAGVGLLWRDNLKMVGGKTWKDKEGRIICVGLELEGIKIVFCSVYAPNLASSSEVQEGYVNFLIQVQLLQDEAMKECGTETLVMMGDLNMILDRDLDSFSSNPKVYQGPKDALMDLVFHQKLTDAFRWANGNKRTFTFSRGYSENEAPQGGSRDPVRVYNRLDYIFVSDELAGAIKKCKHLPKRGSDHKAVLLEWGQENTEKKRKGYWRHNDLLNRDERFLEEIPKVVDRVA